MEMFHYTDRAGYNSIRSTIDWCFKVHRPPPRDRDHPAAAYFTTLAPGTPNLDRLQIPLVKRRFVLVFEDLGDLTPLRGGRGRYIFYSIHDYVVERGCQIDLGESTAVEDRRRGSRGGSAVIIGGIDIIIDVPPHVPAVGLILGRLRRLWPGAMFVDADEVDYHPINDPRVLIRGERSREFLVYRDRAAVDAWRREGATPDDPNSMLHFILDSSGRAGEVQQLTLVCGERTEEIDRFVGDLRQSFRASQLPAHAA